MLRKMAAAGETEAPVHANFRDTRELRSENVISSTVALRQRDRRADRKAKRNEGKCYISSRGHLVAAKEFRPVESCCKRLCHSKMRAEEQRCAFKRFWENGSYNCQNNFLAGMMSSVDTQCKKRSPKTRNRRCAWRYSVDDRGKKVTVCQLFFRSLLQVSEKRLRNLQEKLLSSEAILDRRGSHGNREGRVSADVWMLLPHFCNSLLHMGTEDTATRGTLFESFADYFQAITGNELKLSQSTFAKQFNTYTRFSFLYAGRT